MQDFQHFFFEKAIREGNNCIEYDWPSHDVHAVDRQSYRVCLVSMTQTNINTGINHALLRLDMRVNTGYRIESSMQMWAWDGSAQDPPGQSE